jgi:hypothetical protein
LRSSLYHWKALGMWMFKMGSHESFEHLKHKLWPKEGSGVELTIWLPTTKSRESPQCPCVQVPWHIPLEHNLWRLQLCFRPHLNRKSSHKVTSPESLKSPNFGNFGTPRTKCHLGAGPVARHIVYYKGEGGGFPQVRAMVSLMSPSLPMAHPSNISVLTMQ